MKLGRIHRGRLKEGLGGEEEALAPFHFGK